MMRARLPRPSLWRRRKASLRARDGFLLLETLAAVAIMALLLTVLPSSIVVSRQSVQKSGDVVGARLVAESVLTNDFTGPEFALGTREGELAGYAWTSSVEAQTTLMKAFPSKDWMPYTITVSVLVPNGRIVSVETVRVRRNK
jgi:general secretion pathway protein I